MGASERRKKRAAARQAPPGCELPAIKPRPTIASANAAPRGRPPKDTQALDARCVAFGLPPSEYARRVMDQTWASEPIGMVLMRQLAGAAKPEQAINRLWQVWLGVMGASERYRARIIGKTGRPDTLVLAMLPERIETDEGHTIDTRSSDERDDDAVRGWIRWQHRIARLQPWERDAISASVNRETGALWHQRAPTTRGHALHAALAALADVMDREEAEERRRRARRGL